MHILRTVLKWLAVFVVGIAIGSGFAIWQIRSSGLGQDIRVGPWTTGRDIGSADADAKTRAIVALRGLLALPREEARYFTAATDSAGRRLSGKCTYTIVGGEVEARWWSITLYDRAGWLIPNRWNKHSVGSAQLLPYLDGSWFVIVAPFADSNLWIPTGTDGAFELTLRTYRPRGTLASDPAQVVLPAIVRGECAA